MTHTDPPPSHPGTPHASHERESEHEHGHLDQDQDDQRGRRDQHGRVPRTGRAAVPDQTAVTDQTAVQDQVAVQDQSEILDLDAEVLAEHLSAIVSWLPLSSPPRRIVDLGCGTGAGTFALLDRFPDARVVAVDASPVHLRRLEEKAAARGVRDRVRTVSADLDGVAWPGLGAAPDLVWASAAMHHMADPDRALRTVHDLLAPGGLFAVVELAGLPSFLPKDAPEDRPGLEDRCHAAADSLHSRHVPHRGADWGPMLAAAGFAVEGERTIAVNVAGSRSPAVGGYALATLQRIRHAAAEVLTADDLVALDELLDTDGPHSILCRDDLSLRTDRTVWAARRT